MLYRGIQFGLCPEPARESTYSRGTVPREGGKVFGQGSRAPVSITILVKNSNAAHDKCRIHYRDIGDYLTRDEKLTALREAVSISGFSDWQEIIPDKYNDWIGQRNDAFSRFTHLAHRRRRQVKWIDAIFRLYSLGVVTGRDAYIYNFSREVCAENAQRMVEDYLGALSAVEGNSDVILDKVLRLHSSNLKWNRELEKNLRRKKKTQLGRVPPDSFISTVRCNELLR